MITVIFHQANIEIGPIGYWKQVQWLSWLLQKVSLRPKLKLYLFPLTQLTLKKTPYSKNLFQFSVKNYFFSV